MLTRRLAMVLAAMVLTFGVSSAPTFAKDGSGNSGDGNSQAANAATASSTASEDNGGGQTEQSDQQSSTQKDQETQVEQEANPEVKNTQEDTLGTESNQQISDLLKTHQKHSDTARQKNCQAAQHGLTTKLKRLSTNATAFQAKIDSALNLAIAYQKDNNITVANFDQLVAAAQAAQSQAAASVSVLNGLSPNLDCAQNTVATNVAQFKVAAQQAKTDLLAYKDAVRAVLQALQTAKGGN